MVPPNNQYERSTIEFPLGISPDRRRIVDAAGAPVFFQGDAGWELITNTTPDEAERYLDDRVAKGFNTLLLLLIERLFLPGAPRNKFGEEPFTVPGDFCTPNDAYMDYAEQVLQMAADRNFVVFLLPAFLGYPNPVTPIHPEFGGQPEGWYDEVMANEVEGCRAYGEYLAKKFGRFDNIVWVIGGDRKPEDATSRLVAIKDGLRAGGVKTLLASHVLPECSALDLPGMDWVDINFTYTYTIVHAKLHDDWRRDPVYPYLLIESAYEGELNSSALQIRRQAWWSVVCGGCGHVFANSPLWFFSPGWIEAMDAPGSWAMAHLGRFFRGLPWFDLVPDLDERIGIGGLGERRGLDRVATAATPDGKLMVSHLPAKRALTVDTGQLHDGPLEVSWYEPATGRVLTEQPIEAGGVLDFLPPFSEDAVLTLRCPSVE